LRDIKPPLKTCQTSIASIASQLSTILQAAPRHEMVEFGEDLSKQVAYFQGDDAKTLLAAVNSKVVRSVQRSIAQLTQYCGYFK
jgi:hypothetical protein